MGHTRLGPLPKSQKWTDIVAALYGSVDLSADSQSGVQAVAALALDATQAGLERAVGDRGLLYAYYLLTQLVQAARHDNWEDRLDAIGVRLPKDATVLDLTVEVHAAIDDYLASHGRRTDISEMAQQAAGEALANAVTRQTGTLFGTGRDDLRAALYRLSTKAGFTELSKAFFGRFMARFLNFYLSRATASTIGGRSLQQIGDVVAFNDTLNRHCMQSAEIVRKFGGDWYSSTQYHQGIDLENTSRFMAHALDKLQAELKMQRAVQ